MRNETYRSRFSKRKPDRLRATRAAIARDRDRRIRMGEYAGAVPMSTDTRLSVQDADEIRAYLQWTNHLI